MAYPHWEYFLALDADLENIARYIEFAPANYSAYSIELVRIILAACSEVDVVAKAFCELIDPTKRAKDINDYRNIITGKYPLFHTIEITVPRYGLSFTPLAEWAGTKNPGWWKDYNKVKHYRSVNFEKASLLNGISSVAGLYALVLYYYKLGFGISLISPKPKILSMDTAPGIVLSHDYVLPDS